MSNHTPRDPITLQLVALALISLPPALLYFAASSGAAAWIWPLLALIVLGNLLAIAVY